ncbi:hypothetical protein J1605_010204 [Eschrichtius robustus]|uniref:Uncharacterized protein n=1 Tax=Eschrichtius robustus TaxID=9764 RepID=A0AB34GUA6_ESCRO|nr:hypothetical protein J1605_010204 [Eschrichtius robustus]
MGRTRYREESQFNGTSPSAGRLVQRPNSIAWNSVTQAGHQQFNRPYSRGQESTPERHGAHSTRHFWDTDLPTPPSGVRPPPQSTTPRAPRCSPSHPSPAGYAKRMRGGLPPPLSTPGSVVSLWVPVGLQSPTSRRNLEKSEHSRHPGPYPHLHTCPVTSRSRSDPTRWASVRAGPRGELRPGLPFSGLCWRRRGPLPASHRPPPRPLPAPLSPAGRGPVPEERRRPPQQPQEGRRRWAPQEMPLPGCSGVGQCERRRGSKQGAAAAAAATEGPRAGGGGGGGLEGHRRRR